MSDIGNSPRVVVSLLHWNTLDCTMRCLDSLAALDYSNHEVVLVDNASADESVTAIRDRFPELRVFINPTNLGFAGGHATALRYAQQQGAAAIWLVNSDCVVHPAALAELVTAWQELGPAIYGGVPLRRRVDGRFELNFPHRFLRPLVPGQGPPREPGLPTDGSNQLEPYAVAAVPGSCMLLPLTVIERVGWMAPDWFLYCEELDYCLRLRRLDVPSYLVPRATIEHAGGGSHHGRKRVADCVSYYQTRNEIVLALRHSGRFHANIIAFKKALRAAACIWSRPVRTRSMLLGILDALRGRMGKTLAPEEALLRDAREAADSAAQRA